MQKKCQKGVNTRENGSSRRAVYVYYDARAHPQSIVLSQELSLLFILAAGNFSNMFTTYSHTLCGCPRQRLETRNQLRKRQEKNEFYFQLRQKNFLDWKMKRACRRENKKQCVEKIS